MIKAAVELNHTLSEDLELNRVLPLPQGGAPPEWLPLVPAGKKFRGRDGRFYRNPGAGTISLNQEKRGLDPVIDIEHATELKAPKGEHAPAVGWVKEFKVEDGALLGKVEWNSTGRSALENNEYRYYSPVYRVNRASRDVLYVKSIGLTNSPNLPFPALNQEEPEGGEQLFPESILTALSLNAEATETEVLDAIKNLKSKSELNSEMVPRADYDTVRKRAETAETELNRIKEDDLKDKAQAAVDKAVKEGKIAPSSKDYYLDLCNSEEALEKFEKHMEGSAPVIETNREETPGGEPPDQSTELNSEEKEIAAQLGLTDEKAREYFGKGEAK